MTPQLMTLADYEALSRERLAPDIWAYIHGGAADEWTLRSNAESWQRLELWPRVLRPLSGGHTQIPLAGQTLAHPILLAPVAHQQLAHPDGETASALAAAAQGAGYVLSTQSSVPLETVARAALGDPGRGPLWFQLYWQHDRAFNLELAERARAAGYEALVVTADAPVSGARDRERRSGFRLPSEVTSVHLHGLPPLPQADTQTYCGGLPAHALSWEDLSWLQARTPLPIWLKGVLHPLDALHARQLGVTGVIVSNHGGRTLDTAPATARALPRIAEALQGTLPLIVDGGIRRGTDVLKAMALGASAVLIGRPAMYGLAAAGALGVARVIRLLRDELEIAMALSGCRTLGEATPALIDSAFQTPTIS